MSNNCGGVRLLISCACISTGSVLSSEAAIIIVPPTSIKTGTPALLAASATLKVNVQHGFSSPTRPNDDACSG